MSKKNGDISRAVILSKRMDIREALRESLKKHMIENVQVSSTRAQASAILKEDERSLVVIDWELGEEIILPILDSIGKDHQVYTRPIILLGKNADQKLIGIAYEYHINRVYTGDISVKRIQEMVGQLVKEEQLSQPLRAVFRSVLKARKDGNPSGADSILREALTRAPGNPKIICELAENLILQEKWQDAMTLLEPIKDIEPPFLRSLNLLGRCRMKLQDYDGAIQVLSRAKVLNPFKADRLIALGQSMLQVNRLAEAKENFKEAATLEPGRKDAVFGQGQCLLLEGEVNEALEILKDISNTRELASLFNSSAIIAMRRGNFNDGFALYDAASSATSEDKFVQARLFFNKGLGYKRCKQLKEAMQCFADSIKNDNAYEKAKRNYLFLTKKLGVPVDDQLKTALSSTGSSGISSTMGSKESDMGIEKGFDQDMSIGVGIDTNDAFENDFDEGLPDSDSIAIL